MTSQHISSIENLNRPWAIVRVLPNARYYPVARFCNRQDADDSLRFLHRFLPKAKFEIVFDAPDKQNNKA